MRVLSIVSIFCALFISTQIFSQNETCAGMDPICTDAGLSFTAQTGVTAASTQDPGNNYGCLSTSPNPTWFYLEVATSGDIVMNLSAGSDVDFALWGPFPSLANAQSNCNSFGAPVSDWDNGSNSGYGCSYSSSATETPGIQNAQVGDVYVLLITNYASVSQQITLTQTGGTGATDCNILNPTCFMSFLDVNISACTGGVFDITGSVEFSDPPTTGTLTVTNCSGDQQVFTPPFTSPTNYSITGITADATTGCSVTAVFSADPACTMTSGTFTEPECVCTMTELTALQGVCNPGTDTYGMTGTVDFSEPPSSGTLIIEINDGVTIYDTIINMPFNGPYDWSITGMDANGNNTTITAYFSADPACTLQLTSTAPSGCTCSASVGSFTTTTTGDGTTNYKLCFGDSFDLTSDGNGTPHNDMSEPTVTYDPGYGFAVFSCPQTVFAPNDFWNTDPCFEGWVQIDPANPDAYTETNVLGGPNWSGAWTDNTLYYVPVTFYSLVDGYLSVYYPPGLPCFETGSPIAVQFLPEITTSQTVTCTDATITINGGLPQLDGSNFTLSNLSPASASLSTTSVADGGTVTITGLQNGDNYSFDIIDNNGCPITFSGGPFVGNPVADAGPDATECSLSYSLAAVPSVGTGTWTSSGGGTFSPNANSSTATVTVSSAGSYTFTWTENNGGCIDSDDVIIQFSNVSYTDNIVQSTCGNADGSITLSGSNGIPTYTYSIDGGATSQGTGTFTALLSGNYNVVVEDAIGCQATGVSTISDQGGPVINSVTPVDVSCNATCDGSIAINATGATQFSIDNGVTFQASNTFSSLCAGPYNVVVENAVGCQAISQTTINEPTVIDVTTSKTDLSCFNVCNGDIVISASGGTGTLQYSINNGVTSQLSGTFSGLCAGSYDVVVEDANGCQFTSNVVLTEPTELTLTLGVTNASCAGVCDGVINSIPAGGTGAGTYSYNWSNGQTNPLVTNLCVGTYSLTVTDANSCAVDTVIDISGPQAVTIDNIVSTDELCGGDCTGQLAITATNAVSYSLDGVNFQPGNTFSNLCAGNYTVYVKDAGSCATDSPALVSGPSSVVVQALSDTMICIGGTATLTSQATGGVGGYSYSWDNGNVTQNINVSPISGTSFCVVATDANGCSSPSQCVFVSMYSALQVNAFGDTPICNGTTADISAIAQGGISPYVYTWNQGVGVGIPQTVSPVATTTYTVTVTDQCETPSVTADVTITVNPIPVVGFTADSLNGCYPLEVTFTESSTIPVNSTCFWNFGDGGISQECNPTYIFDEPGCWPVSLTVTTQAGCSNDIIIQDYICVYDYPTADFVFGPQPTTVLEPAINFINLSENAAGYLWTIDTQGAAEISTDENPVYVFPNTNPGTYEVCLVATTPYGCAADTCKDVVIHEEFIVYVPNAFTPDGDAFNNEFKPVVKGIDPLRYEFLVFNRWGELIYEGAHPSLGWNGYYKGVLSQTDVYVWKLKVVEESNNQTHEYIGHVTLLK